MPKTTPKVEPTLRLKMAELERALRQQAQATRAKEDSHSRGVAVGLETAADLIRIYLKES